MNMITREVKRRVEEIKAKTEEETLQDLMNQEDYFTYMRVLDDKSYDAYSNSIVFEKIKEHILYGTTHTFTGLVTILVLLASMTSLFYIQCD